MTEEVLKESTAKIYKEGKTFKQYYADNPEFRLKQLKYQKEKVMCVCCNHEHQRCNLSNHNKTKKHIANKEAKDKADAITKDNETMKFIINYLIAKTKQ